MSVQYYKVDNVVHFRRTFVDLHSLAFTDGVEWAPRDKFIVWEGTLRPFPDCNKYTFCLNYELKEIPKIWIVEPNLLVQTNLPHVYEDKTLCLYHPKDWQWTASQRIIPTVLTWAIAWAFYYEDYCRSKYWRGPEADHHRPSCYSGSCRARKKNPKVKIKTGPKYLRDYPIRLSNSARLTAHNNSQKGV